MAVRLLILLSLFTVIGCTQNSSTISSPTKPILVANQNHLPAVEPKNVVFPGTSFTENSKPNIVQLSPPFPERTSAVWGSLGRDHRGHIYFGASCESSANASAHLLEFDPPSNQLTDRGGALEQLKRRTLKPNVPALPQNKIHTKILQAPDGNLYFASMDETGELDDGSVLPIYGSHIWRMKPGSNEWNHLKSVPEGIVASAIHGTNVYFLGYFGHVVYRLDTNTNQFTQTRIGATGGHVSRNFFTDNRGHVFVPRVRSGSASLVELTAELDEVNSTPLNDYDVSPTADSHGIVSYTPMKDGTICFLTDGGRLYRVKDGVVQDRGMIDPKGKAYVSCLMSPDGDRWLCGIGHAVTKGEPVYEWIVHDMQNQKSTAQPITIPTTLPESKSLLIYGSYVRDDAGAWYLGGAYRSGPASSDFTPAVWKVTW